MKKGMLIACIMTALMAVSCKNKAENAVSKVDESKAQAIMSEEKANEANGTTIAFDTTSYDFGDIKEGDVVETVFTFTNTGDKPLIIQSAVGSCGCTVPEKPEEPIAAGQKGEIKVQFNSAGKKGVNNKTVTLQTNTPEKTQVLNIKANVL